MEQNGVKLIGDVVIALEVIHQEAKSLNRSFEAHLTHMIVHGVLHLLGYNHIEEKEAQHMQNIEKRVLKTLNIEDPYKEY